MKAVGYQTPQPIDQPDALLDITLPEPVATGRDLLVEVKAVSVNPVDTKVRKSALPADGQTHKVLGWDASGIVKAVGPDVTLFQPGDRVWYAGSIARAGTNAELHLVDERIVGHMPKSLDFAQAAALPLTPSRPGNCCSIASASRPASSPRGRRCSSSAPPAAWAPSSRSWPRG